MVYIYAVPPWFCGYDSLVELIFAIITLLVGVYAYRIYSLTRQKPSYLFALSFFSISISYFILAAYNYFLLSNINTKICTIANISNVTLFTNSQMYLHLILYTIGLLLLLYITLKSPCKRVFSIVAVVTIVSLFMTLKEPHGAYILSSILLGYIFWHYLENYRLKKALPKLLVAVGFGFLLLANMLFIFSFHKSDRS